MFDRRRRRRQAARARPGDASPLKDYRFWQLFHRTVFTVDLPGPSGDTDRYAVDVHHLADELDRHGRTEEPNQSPPVSLYRNGIQTHRANPPVRFAVSGGSIEVARSVYGLKRMHYVPENGPAEALTPHPLSLEGWRSRFERRFPALSRAIGALAIVVLLAGLVVTVPFVIELITRIEVVADLVGTFNSPIDLPGWANTGLIVAGVLAAMERALTLRSHWFIDADTTWTNFT